MSQFYCRYAVHCNSHFYSCIYCISSHHSCPPSTPTPHSDLSTHTALLDVIIGAFSSPTEEIRAAASYALGSVSAGNLQLYLPVILQEIEAKPRRQYLLLHSLKEVREGGGGGEQKEAVGYDYRKISEKWNG